MNFDDILTTIKASELSAEGKAVITAIVDAAKERGSFTEDEKDKILAVLNFETAITELEAVQYEAEAASLDELLGELNDSVGQALTEIELLTGELESDLGDPGESGEGA